MDRAHRQELKHDKFVDQVGHTVEYAAHHRGQVATYGAIALAVLLVGGGVYGYMGYQEGQRQDALRTAIRVQEAQLGQSPNEFQLGFPDQAKKDAAVDKAWQDVISKYSGSNEAMVAQYYRGINFADRGKIQEAEKELKAVADNAKDTYASQAKLALARIYESTGKIGEAEKVLRSLIDKPTILVTKEQATILLGKLLAQTKPAEARKLLEPLRTERGAVSRAAITALSEVPAGK